MSSTDFSAMSMLNVFPRLMHVLMHDFDSGDIQHNELHISQVKTLLHLQHKGPSSMTPLCHRINLEKSSMTAVVDTLINLGLAERQRDDKDRRKVLVHLTPEGIETAEQFEKEISKHILTKLNMLTTQEVDAFWASLKQLNSLTDIIKERTT